MSAGRGRVADGAADGASEHGAGCGGSGCCGQMRVERHGCRAGRDGSMVGDGKWRRMMMMHLEINKKCKKHSQLARLDSLTGSL